MKYIKRGKEYIVQINRYTDYAYRILLYLAANPGERATMADISSYYGISHEHLRKVVHNLSKHGYIQTYLGKSGGMELKRNIAKINLAQVFSDFEGVKPLIDCIETACPLTPSCSLNDVFKKAQKVFLNELKQYTLADLLKRRSMVQLLSADVK